MILYEIKRKKKPEGKVCRMRAHIFDHQDVSGDRERH